MYVDMMLKPTTENDYEDYYRIRSCPSDVYQNGYKSAPNKESFKEGFLKRLGDASLKEPEDRRNYLIQLKDNNSDVTSIGFVQLIKREDGIDISYTVIEEYQGHGYATRALLMGVELAKKLDKRVYVQIRDDNIASQGVARKCGFVRTEEYTLQDYPQVGSVPLRKYRLQMKL